MSEKTNLENFIAFWSDISIVVLLVLMEQNNETKNVQYLNVKNRAEQIMSGMISRGIEKGTFDRSIDVFMKIRKDFLNSELLNVVPEHLVPATIVAIAVKQDLEQDLDEEDFTNVVRSAYEYLAS